MFLIVCSFLECSIKSALEGFKFALALMLLTKLNSVLEKTCKFGLAIILCAAASLSATVALAKSAHWPNYSPVCYKPYSTYISCQTSELFTLLKIIQVKVSEMTDSSICPHSCVWLNYALYFTLKDLQLYWHSFSLYIGSNLKGRSWRRQLETWCKRFSEEYMLTSLL